jgi:hypothetical protein
LYVLALTFCYVLHFALLWVGSCIIGVYKKEHQHHQYNKFKEIQRNVGMSVASFQLYG